MDDQVGTVGPAGQLARLARLARWPGGPVARWPGGPVARWPGGPVARWPGWPGWPGWARWPGGPAGPVAKPFFEQKEPFFVCEGLGLNLTYLRLKINQGLSLSRTEGFWQILKSTCSRVEIFYVSIFPSLGVLFVFCFLVLPLLFVL